MTQRVRPALACTGVCLALSLAACANAPGDASTSGELVELTGVIAAIDTRPWTYDGNAVVEVDVEASGRRVAVQLPARWNLCAAPPVDIDALSVGQRVRVVGDAGQGDGLVVCEEATHRLVPLD